MDQTEIIELKANVADMLTKILRFVDCSDYEIEEAKELVDAYKTEQEEEKLREIRRKLNKIFFETYRDCVFKSFDVSDVPIQVQMFLIYGIMDESLAGIQNAVALCKLTETYFSRPRTYCISLYEWLCYIETGIRMPSMNDMSVDYEQDLREKLKTKEITENEYASLIKDRTKKVMYELQTAFSIMKRVSGAPTRFLAMFNEAALEKPFIKTIVVNNDLESFVDGLCNIDVNLFCHEYTYANEKAGIGNARILKEIKPDIVLLPVIGSRPMMWQEIEGRNRQTPSRFFYPKFLNTELKDTMIKCCGAYRWEFCKREQGARWQDVSDPSLCAYFYNYIQTFKKNHALSQEQKEKVNAQYSKYRHNVKDIFIDDYVKFIANEAAGNIRLNKESRRILMRFCILNKYIREELVKNNLYTEYINVINNKIEHDKKQLALMKKRIDDSGLSMPSELVEYEEIINR